MTSEWFEDYRAAYIHVRVESLAASIADHLAEKRAQIGIENRTETPGMTIEELKMPLPTPEEVAKTIVICCKEFHPTLEEVQTAAARLIREDRARRA